MVKEETPLRKLEYIHWYLFSWKPYDISSKSQFMIGLSNPLPMSWLLTCMERTTKMENDNEIIHVLILNCFCCQMNKLYAVNCTSFVSTSNAGDYFWHHERILIAFLNMLKLEQKTLNYCLKVMISLLYCIPRFFVNH